MIMRLAHIHQCFVKCRLVAGSWREPSKSLTHFCFLAVLSASTQGLWQLVRSHGRVQGQVHCSAVGGARIKRRPGDQSHGSPELSRTRPQHDHRYKWKPVLPAQRSEVWPDVHIYDWTICLCSLFSYGKSSGELHVYSCKTMLCTGLNVLVVCVYMWYFYHLITHKQLIKYVKESKQRQELLHTQTRTTARKRRFWRRYQTVLANITSMTRRTRCAWAFCPLESHLVSFRWLWFKTWKGGSQATCLVRTKVWMAAFTLNLHT